MTKTAQAIELWNKGDELGALRLFHTFRLGFDKAERNDIKTLYECRTGKRRFYESLGIDISELEDRVAAVLNNYCS